MTVFGKRLGEYAKFARAGMIVIVLVGLARFAVGLSGVPYDRATHLVSMTITTTLLAVVYGTRVAACRFGGYRHLLPVVVMLALAMYGFIIAAILVEGLGGFHGYFHAPGHGLQPHGMDLRTHIGGQLTAMFFSIAAFWLFAVAGFALSRHLVFVRRGLLILVAVGAARVALGASGVPFAIGTWPTSLTLAAIALAVYYGYRAAVSGWGRWVDVLLLGIVIGTALVALAIYGIAVTTALGIPNYFHAPGAGFQPAEWTVAQHVRAHLQGSFVVMIVLTVLAGIAFAFGRRKRQAAVGAAVQVPERASTTSNVPR